MRLTKFTDLALRVVVRPAVADEAGTPASRQVAEAVAAPYTHVSEVVSRLQHPGVPEAGQGRRAGAHRRGTHRLGRLAGAAT
ncbi:hypothetical protein GCM10010420_33680 [Streptomyces glaucosporus]|uniref:Uncharacterized protein n=1 Tax=Streptomyces glaucosporus TaxID=284044 RepID=A0ABP5VHW9_9ACTN